MKNTPITHFDDKWAEHIARVPQTSELAKMTDEELEQAMGFRNGEIAKYIRWSIISWRNSPSSSLLNGLNMIDGRQEVPEGPIFDNLLSQTRFVELMRQNKLITGLDWEIVNGKDRKPIKVTHSNYALKAVGMGADRMNQIIRILDAYQRRSQAQVEMKAVKLPRVLYRGIRFRDLWEVPEFKAIREDNKPLYDVGRFHSHQANVDDIKQAMTTIPYAQIAHSRVLSFTETKSVAEFFANGEGIVLAIPTSGLNAEIITSHKHDYSLAGPDPFNGRTEKEWILRIGSDMILKPENIIVSDLDYAMANNDPLCVQMFDSQFDSAEYELDGHKVMARFYWKTNTKGSVGFIIDNDYFALSRREVKTNRGFDPMPTPENLDRISNFQLFDIEQWRDKREPKKIPGPRVSKDVEPGMDGPKL